MQTFAANGVNWGGMSGPTAGYVEGVMLMPDDSTCDDGRFPENRMYADERPCADQDGALGICVADIACYQVPVGVDTFAAGTAGETTVSGCIVHPPGNYQFPNPCADSAGEFGRCASATRCIDAVCTQWGFQGSDTCTMESGCTVGHTCIGSDDTEVGFALGVCTSATECKRAPLTTSG